MKKKKDPRHVVREKIIKELFAYSFEKPNIKEEEAKSERTKEILKKLPKIDKQIAKAATEWPLEKIAKIDLAILRLAVFELLEKKEPHKVIIDEAVELAKEYGGDTSPAFVNGVLGTIHSWLIKQDKNRR